ncbi:hypothetical protein [Sphingomonas jaspsi]|uniref:hypothetical protein n=1 Tax=Sphingomonas jaspsi TaxID=392409 RepID=UPI0004B406D3|nr:hypothetical protein [Sphingomonas jaspsi]
MKTYPVPFPSLRRPIFGRGRRYVLGTIEQVKQIGDDTRLFVTTFIGGFLFMTIYLA